MSFHLQLHRKHCRSSVGFRGFGTFELWIQGPQFTACADQDWTAYLGSKPKQITIVIDADAIFSVNGHCKSARLKHDRKLAVV